MARPPRERAGGHDANSSGRHRPSRERCVHVGLLSPPEIAQRLDLALDAPGAGARRARAPTTLRVTIDWSHALLDDAEKACFARLAVFAGGTTLEAADAVTGAGVGVLDGLVAQSLLARRTKRTRRPGSSRHAGVHRRTGADRAAAPKRRLSRRPHRMQRSGPFSGLRNQHENPPFPAGSRRAREDSNL